MAGEKFVSLQILRGAAAAAVVWYHATIFAGFDLGLARSYGGAGVDIFFVLSGFVIYRSGFACRRMAPTVFLRKRLTRILPLYYVLTLMWLPVAALIGLQHFENIATSFLFWPAWSSRFDFPVIGQGWTLCVEMLFYLSAGLVLFWPRSLYLVAAGFLAAWAYHLPFLGNAIILEFVFGVLIAAYWRPCGEKIWIPVITVSVCTIVFLGCCFPALGYDAVAFGGTLAILRAILWGVPAALIVMGALALESKIKRGRITDFLVYLGDASYSIYLAGSAPLALAALVVRPTTNLSAALLQIGLFAIAMATGLVCYHFIETPIMNAIRSTTRGAMV